MTCPTKPALLALVSSLVRCSWASHERALLSHDLPLLFLIGSGGCAITSAASSACADCVRSGCMRRRPLASRTNSPTQVTVLPTSNALSLNSNGTPSGLSSPQLPKCEVASDEGTRCASTNPRQVCGAETNDCSLTCSPSDMSKRETSWPATAMGIVVAPATSSRRSVLALWKAKGGGCTLSWRLCDTDAEYSTHCLPENGAVSVQPGAAFTRA
mmetsp:Transcript_46680/g.125338  ORF Transcript_46680/g.125338 Transcript_46680/m.125338 type:complete len:214 (+) Transcript_46680:246-887(+)